MFGICNLAIVPIRAEASDKSEQVSQLLFGEHFKIIELTAKWAQVELAYDNYIGWIDTKQFQKISKEGILKIGETIELMAEAEGLQAHKNAVTIRLKDLIPTKAGISKE